MTSKSGFKLDKIAFTATSCPACGGSKLPPKTRLLRAAPRRKISRPSPQILRHEILRGAILLYEILRRKIPFRQILLQKIPRFVAR